MKTSFEFQVASYKLLCVSLLICLWKAPATAAEDLAVLCADRLAVERVYHNHRLGTKPPFEQALSPALIEQSVKQDLHKEAVLKKVYGVDITPTMVEAEVQRIDATTRAPEVLAELKAELGNARARFARTVARPIVVERTLRARFENDDALHTVSRQNAERLRARLLAVKESDGADQLVALLKESSAGTFHEAVWQLTARPPGPQHSTLGPDTSAPTEVKARSAVYSLAATAQLAQVLNPPARAHEEARFFFDELPADLQNVLRVQLRQPGDVSAVIEMPGSFLVYVLRSRTPEAITTASSSIAKRGYEDWLSVQRTEFNPAEPTKSK